MRAHVAGRPTEADAAPIEEAQLNPFLALYRAFQAADAAKGPTMADRPTPEEIMSNPPKFLPDDFSGQRDFYKGALPSDSSAKQAGLSAKSEDMRAFFRTSAMSMLVAEDPRSLKPGSFAGQLEIIAEAAHVAAYNALVSLMTDEAKAVVEARRRAIWDQVLGIGLRPTLVDKAPESPPDEAGPETWRDRPPLL